MTVKRPSARDTGPSPFGIPGPAALAIGPAGEHLRLAGDAAATERPAIVEALRAAFTPHLRPDGVWLPSSTWLVSAVRRERT